jgi:hypothetical protein
VNAKGFNGGASKVLQGPRLDCGIVLRLDASSLPPDAPSLRQSHDGANFRHMSEPSS